MIGSCNLTYFGERAWQELSRATPQPPVAVGQQRLSTSRPLLAQISPLQSLLITADMTIAIPMHRALSTKLAGRSFNVVTRLGYNPWLARVNHDSPSNNESKPSQPSSRSSRICFVATRSYATSATAKPVSRPKAHTGRTPAKRTRTAAPKKPGPKTAAGKKAVGRKPKPKPKAKKAPAKPKPKPRKPAVKKVPSKTALNQARIAKEKAVKEKALLDTPKKLSETPWTIIFAEAQTGSKAGEQTGNAKIAGEKLKNLTPEEKEVSTIETFPTRRIADTCHLALQPSRTHEQRKERQGNQAVAQPIHPYPDQRSQQCTPTIAGRIPSEKSQGQASQQVPTPVR